MRKNKREFNLKISSKSPDLQDFQCFHILQDTSLGKKRNHSQPHLVPDLSNRIPYLKFGMKIQVHFFTATIKTISNYTLDYVRICFYISEA